MLTDQQKEEYVGQFAALLHANVDGDVVLIEARRKSDNKEVLIACIQREITVPPRIFGGEPTTAQQIVPIFEFVDPHGDNPYESADPSLKEIPPSNVLRADSFSDVRDGTTA